MTLKTLNPETTVYKADVTWHQYQYKSVASIHKQFESKLYSNEDCAVSTLLLSKVADRSSALAEGHFPLTEETVNIMLH